MIDINDPDQTYEDLTGDLFKLKEYSPPNNTWTCVSRNPHDGSYVDADRQPTGSVTPVEVHHDVRNDHDGCPHLYHRSRGAWASDKLTPTPHGTLKGRMQGADFVPPKVVFGSNNDIQGTFHDQTEAYDVEVTHQGVIKKVTHVGQPAYPITEHKYVVVNGSYVRLP